MRVRTPTIVIAAVFGGAALLAAFVVTRVVNARRDLPPGAELPRKGIALLAPEAAAPEGDGWLTGRVTAARGALPAGTAVYAQRPGGAKEPPARTATNPNGHYRLVLPEGDYRVWAAPAGAADARARPAFARVTAGQTATLDLSAEPAPPVSIEVLEPDGAPSRGAVVTLARPGDAKLALATAAGEDGRLGVAAEMGLAGAAVEVHARNGGRTGSWTGAMPESGVVTVRLAHAGTVEATLAGKGKAPAGFVLTVSSQPAPQAWRTVAEHRFSGAGFTLADLPSEPLRLSVKTDDGRRGSAEVTLTPGETRKLEIALSGG